jgi:hypothetical protein
MFSAFREMKRFMQSAQATPATRLLCRQANPPTPFNPFNFSSTARLRHAQPAPSLLQARC